MCSKTRKHNFTQRNTKGAKAQWKIFIAPLLLLYFYYITPGSFKSNNKRNISPLKRYFAGEQRMRGSGRGATAIGVAPLKITYKGQLNKERRPFCCVEKTFSLSVKNPSRVCLLELLM